MDKLPRILFIHNALTEFVRLDLEELRKEFEVTEHFEKLRFINAAALWKQVKNHDLVFGWFASWHTFLPVQFAKLLGKPSILVTGGYDVANMPEIKYGHQRGGLKKWMSRRTMRLATQVVAFSSYSQNEIRRNVGLANGSVRTVYLGVPDRFGELPRTPRKRIALTVGNVDRGNLQRKGHETFVRAAALLPDVSFVLVGTWKGDAIDYLRSIATPNVIFTGRVSDEVLRDYYAKASVYAQPSLHEGFGLSVAEAMLAGCIPVVSRAGSLPEVTGDIGIFFDTPEPTAIAQAIEKALGYPQEARASARQRILDRFPVSKRSELLEELIRLLTKSTQVRFFSLASKNAGLN
jgi:glycosyltransferase involved in cell wall biosynthesis